MRKLSLPALAILALAACGSPDSGDDSAAGETPEPAAPMEAVAQLQTADGAGAGTATATAAAAGATVMLALEVTGLPPGEHGVHVHMTGKCDAPSFESAGGHWNPAEQAHGLEDPSGQHAGDMPNLTVAADGTGSLEYQLVGGSFAGLADADGSAFVVHAMPDDQTTDPSGNSGDRIACGVFSAG